MPLAQSEWSQVGLSLEGQVSHTFTANFAHFGPAGKLVCQSSAPPTGITKQLPGSERSLFSSEHLCIIMNLHQVQVICLFPVSCFGCETFDWLSREDKLGALTPPDTVLQKEESRVVVVLFCVGLTDTRFGASQAYT